MVLYILIGYWVLGIVYLNQLSGARHTHISYYDIANRPPYPFQFHKFTSTLSVRGTSRTLKSWETLEYTERKLFKLIKIEIEEAK